MAQWSSWSFTCRHLSPLPPVEPRVSEKYMIFLLSKHWSRMKPPFVFFFWIHPPAPPSSHVICKPLDVKSDTRTRTVVSPSGQLTILARKGRALPFGPVTSWRQLSCVRVRVEVNVAFTSTGKQDWVVAMARSVCWRHRWRSKRRRVRKSFALRFAVDAHSVRVLMEFDRNVRVSLHRRSRLHQPWGTNFSHVFFRSDTE